MNRADMRSNIATTISVTEGGALSTGELNRSISFAVADLSRFIPQLLAEEIHFELDVASESFTADHNIEVALANKPIRKDSETVTNAAATITYTRDTDYEMDYINGTIKALSTGAMLEASHLITYQKHRTVLDIGGLLTTPIYIAAVEYPTDQIPMSFCGFEWHGDYLTLTTHGPDSQSVVADEDEIRIWYASKWSDPAERASS